MLLLLELALRALVPVRNVGPAFSEHDPIYGKSLRKGFSGERSGPEFRFTVHTNSLGMRDPEPTGSLAGGVLFLGDSFTFGYGVEDNQAFPALVRARLAGSGSQAPVLNAGVGNTGNGRWLRILEREGPHWRPRVVVLQVSSNDVGDNQREKLYALKHGRLRALPVREPRFARLAQRVISFVPALEYSHVVGLGWQIAAGAPIEANAVVPRGRVAIDHARFELTEALLRESIARARALGAEVIGVLADVPPPVDAWACDLFAAQGAPCLRPALKEAAPGHFFAVDGHWNAAGHRALAHQLAPLVIEKLERAEQSARR